MSDDEAYFTDDICFDDQTLAFLDNEEKKYLSQTINAAPATKRQKTDNGWKAGIGTAPTNEPDYLPEISLNCGDLYGVLPGRTNSTGIAQPSAASTTLSSRVHSDQVSVKPSLVPRELPTSSRNLPARTTQHGRPPLASKDVRWPTSREAVRFVPTTQQASSPPVGRMHELEAKLQELQQKLEKISEENKTIQVALNEAVNSKLAKEGEVTVLRKNAEKVSQEHAAQLARLKLCREESEAKQARMQKELKEEAERLKTQLVFKQHEQESTHRPNLPLRSKRIFKDASFVTNSTPRVRDPMHDEPSQPASAPITQVPQPQPRRSPQIRRVNMLPGFENAFNDASSLPLSRNSGKRKQASPAPQHSSPTRQPHTSVLDTAFTMDSFVDETPDGDFEMPFGPSEIGSVLKFDEDDGQELRQITKPPDWKVELNRLVLMHFLPGSSSVTMQLLLRVQGAFSLDDIESDTYMRACQRCLEVIATAPHCEQDWLYFVATLSRSFVSMIPLLRAARSFLPLAALLNLLAILIYSLPDFRSFMLSQTDPGNVESQILVHLSGIILDQRDNERQESYEVLATETVTLLEALLFTAESELVENFSSILQNRQVLMNLFRANQPSWLLARSARLLVLLASHRNLCRFLIAIPDPVEERATDTQKVLLIERLCLYLMDCGRKDDDYKEAKTSILTFFALMSNSQPDVHAHLLTSTTIIPSLVYYLAQLTTAFWEDDEDLLSASSEEISAEIQALNQTLFLLHHLVFTSVSFLNLRQKLHAPYHRIFNGLMHMFVVTFGRLSYGEAPEWIDRQGRIDLVSSTDMARDILDHVVDGPEADRTWQAYQLDGEKANETDEEEMEEQLLGERTQ